MVGSYSFRIGVSDSETQAVADFTLNIDSPLAISTSSPLSPGIAAIPYSQSLTAVGGTSPYVNWSVISRRSPSRAHPEPNFRCDQRHSFHSRSVQFHGSSPVSAGSPTNRVPSIFTGNQSCAPDHPYDDSSDARDGRNGVFSNRRCDRRHGTLCVVDHGGGIAGWSDTEWLDWRDYGNTDDGGNGELHSSSAGFGRHAADCIEGVCADDQSGDTDD